LKKITCDEGWGWKAGGQEELGLVWGRVETGGERNVTARLMQGTTPKMGMPMREEDERSHGKVRG